MSRHGKSLNSKAFALQRGKCSPQSHSCSLCPTVLLFTAEIETISGIVAKIQCKSWEPTELTWSWDAHHWCHRVQLQKLRMKRRWEWDQSSKTNSWSEQFLSPHTSSSSEKFYLSKGKSKIHWEIISEILCPLHPPVLSSTAVNLSTSTLNSLTRRRKTLSTKCLCTSWGQIPLPWSHHIFWTQTLHWCQGREPQAPGSQFRGVPKMQIQTKAEVGNPLGTADWL